MQPRQQQQLHEQPMYDDEFDDVSPNRSDGRYDYMQPPPPPTSTMMPTSTNYYGQPSFQDHLAGFNQHQQPQRRQQNSYAMQQNGTLQGFQFRSSIGLYLISLNVNCHSILG